MARSLEGELYCAHGLLVWLTARACRGLLGGEHLARHGRIGGHGFQLAIFCGLRFHGCALLRQFCIQGCAGLLCLTLRLSDLFFLLALFVGAYLFHRTWIGQHLRQVAA